MKQWLPYELHTHTYHSDGEHSLLELAKSAKELGLFGIAMTDHNTMSPLLDGQSVQSETKLHIIRGMEWTTFFGHMLAIGISDYVDWRDLGIKDIHKGIERVHQQGGIVGIAHPFRIGSPLCTGCYWEYEITNWHDIDYIEVWSYTFPSILNSNIRAFQLWTDLLNQGYKIAGVCGRDWHVSSVSVVEPIAVSYLGMENDAWLTSDEVDYERLAVNAIRRGAVSVTMGPLILCTVQLADSGHRFHSGDEVPAIGEAEKVLIHVEVDFATRSSYWQLAEQELTVTLSSNMGQLAKLNVSRSDSAVCCEVDHRGLKWLRAELSGVFHSCYTMIGFTNPIYFQI
ncbi:CehA/McbA family metallohydrolase [Paenibacillus sp. SYP-B3998]|uniref:CehA/McbA family metallohydrolase n=1 Tax=Paenibacillus sp. SYP-B3998 TaxID=2678564 RepID=A0A6G3ZTS4_9BACL|nr:CehA/McbA family metallohydrolase [Paenibacillus sp. SYP-B3998]NEW04817.1 CehA/McbA family metallohydrolase [Paenibacillus sp. SYP-B3998]